MKNNETIAFEEWWEREGDTYEGSKYDARDGWEAALAYSRGDREPDAWLWYEKNPLAGSEMVPRFATHWSTPPKDATPLYAALPSDSVEVIRLRALVHGLVHLCDQMNIKGFTVDEARSALLFTDKVG